MKKPIPSESGLALTELLYGSEREQTSTSNVNQSRPKSNSTKKRLRSFLMQDFEEGRPMPNSAYEREKRNLHRKPRTADEIQKERIKAARRCKV